MGYVQVYTGNGKGKTTAALGLSLRAVCAGKKVVFIQFTKGMKYSELKANLFLPNFEIKQFGTNNFIFKETSKEDSDLAKQGLDFAKKALKDEIYDVVVLDEVNIAIYYELLKVEDVIAAIKERSENTEVILTGRYAADEIIEFADLVTEMKEIKHYYTKGVPARVGIEK
ncbi:MAG: cob(I)yrinic acid a,c-diamide adenosyltransferase [Clostridiales bacterium]|nr:MAG: cob(I)yrinic acid a,c-diamide adenosyltransferase [Clostridiales bacterium]